MWNKKKEDEYPPKPAAAPAPAPSVHKESPAMSTSPAPVHQGDRGGAAVIGKSVAIKGQIYSREDLTIDGEVEGSVELQEHRLTIGPHGRVQAGIKAREMIVLGTVHGNVEVTDKIDIRKDAKLVGDIKTSRIVIEDGAYFKGSIDITRPEVVTKPAPVQAAPPPPAPAPKPVPTQAAAVGASPAGNPVEPKR